MRQDDTGMLSEGRKSARQHTGEGSRKDANQHLLSEGRKSARQYTGEGSSKDANQHCSQKDANPPDSTYQESTPERNGICTHTGMLSEERNGKHTHARMLMEERNDTHTHKQECSRNDTHHPDRTQRTSAILTA